MVVSKQTLLQNLPAYRNEWRTIIADQDVTDIITDILACHIEFAGDYDLICGYFIRPTVRETCGALKAFCLNNIRYKEEKDNDQTTALPAGILTRGYGDCKHYASFIGGVLDAISRKTGKEINWYYCFASYDLAKPYPYHVFVVVEDGEKTLFVDPTPGADNKTPVYVQNEYVSAVPMAVNGTGKLTSSLNGVSISGAGVSGDLIPAPAWYPNYLPKFYRQPNADLRLLPEGAIKYTDADVLDCLLYLQTIVGYNRNDFANAIAVSWYKTDNKDGFKLRITDHFKGNAEGNMQWVPNYNMGNDGTLYSQLQQRYIANNATAMPWLINMQGKGGGIDLMSIPMATDIEVQRPSFYPDYLPSLFISTGQPFQAAAGALNTKPKIVNYKSSGYSQYAITATDVAALMLYTQPVILTGVTPYLVNWYENDTVNGAQAMYFKISIAPVAGHTNAQAQSWGIAGDLMHYPLLDANPYASGFTKTLQSVVSFAVSYFTGKIPGGAKLTQVANTVAAMGGAGITGDVTPEGSFTMAVYQAADALSKSIAKTTKISYLVIVAAVAVGLGWYYWPEIKKSL